MPLTPEQKLHILNTDGFDPNSYDVTDDFMIVPKARATKQPTVDNGFPQTTVAATPPTVQPQGALRTAAGAA